MKRYIIQMFTIFTYSHYFIQANDSEIPFQKQVRMSMEFLQIRLVLPPRQCQESRPSEVERFAMGSLRRFQLMHSLMSESTIFYLGIETLKFLTWPWPETFFLFIPFQILLVKAVLELNLHLGIHELLPMSTRDQDFFYPIMKNAR